MASKLRCEANDVKAAILDHKSACTSLRNNFFVKAPLPIEFFRRRLTVSLFLPHVLLLIIRQTADIH